MSPTHARTLIGALLLVAAALVYNGAVHRYSTTAVAGWMVTKTDHLTGTVTACKVGRNEPTMVCAPPQ